MNIVVLREPEPETRVALSPSSVKAYQTMGFQVFIEAGLGHGSGFSDDEYKLAGATLMENPQEIVAKANILIAINPPTMDVIKQLAPGSLVMTQVLEQSSQQLVEVCQTQGLGLFALNRLPRITRAQSMDVLSSQTNLAGYRAVLLAAYHFKSVIPMMMTAAGVILPAKVLVLGTGVAGLQAIATAKRLGAEVFAFDVRTAAKEQVESLGAAFIEVDYQENLESETGYALEASEAYQKLQAEKIEAYAINADIIICTALIPGKTSPVLLSSHMVEKMKPGSVVVDLAVAFGGNCPLSVDHKIIKKHGVTIIGESNLAGEVPGTASQLFANNVQKVIAHLWDAQTQGLNINEQDVIIQQSLIVPLKG